jgi:hypothetical protein
MKLTAISVAWLFAASFYAAAAVRLIPNPLLGPDGLFVANTAHDLVHFVTGMGFTAVAVAGAKPSIVFMRAFGVIYALTGLVGFLVAGFVGHGHLLRLVHINALDNFLHLGLGAAIGAAGWYFHTTRGSVQASPAVHEG